MRSYKEQVLSFMANNWADEESGDVQTPFGHFALVEIYEDAWDRRDYQLERVDQELGLLNVENEDIEPGWYLVRTDSDGNLQTILMNSEEEARAEYERLSEAYETWCEYDPESYPQDHEDGEGLRDFPSYAL